MRDGHDDMLNRTSPREPKTACNKITRTSYLMKVISYPRLLPKRQLHCANRKTLEQNLYLLSIIILYSTWTAYSSCVLLGSPRVFSHLTAYLLTQDGLRLHRHRVARPRSFRLSAIWQLHMAMEICHRPSVIVANSSITDPAATGVCRRVYRHSCVSNRPM